MEKLIRFSGSDCDKVVVLKDGGTRTVKVYDGTGGGGVCYRDCEDCMGKESCRNCDYGDCQHLLIQITMTQAEAYAFASALNKL